MRVRVQIVLARKTRPTSDAILKLVLNIVTIGVDVEYYPLAVQQVNLSRDPSDFADVRLHVHVLMLLLSWILNLKFIKLNFKLQTLTRKHCYQILRVLDLAYVQCLELRCVNSVRIRTYLRHQLVF